MRKQTRRGETGWRQAAAVLLLPLVLGAGRSASASTSASVDFNRDVLPILSENCLSCHGMDRNKRMAGLRLDIPDALKPLPDGRIAVVPADLKAIVLYDLIAAKDGQLLPPAFNGKQSNARQ